jgi:sodium-independent sulfate anion transporter 11
MSTIVGNIVIKVQDVHPEIPAEQIARALAVIAGAVLLFIGLIRAGWIVEFISLTAITSFMTGAALSIGVGQVPTLMGIPNVNNRDPTYRVIINTLKGLPNTRLDAAIGLSALAVLYGVRIFCSVMTKKQPHRKKMWFFISTLRMAFVILLYIMISWLANRNIKDAKKAKFKILGKVPRGKYPCLLISTESTPVDAQLTDSRLPARRCSGHEYGASLCHRPGHSRHYHRVDFGAHCDFQVIRKDQ